MAEARGIYRLRMDKNGRIFVNGPMKKYFGMSLAKTKKGKDDNGDASSVFCNIGFPDKPNVPALILLNDSISDIKSAETREEDMKNLFTVAPNQNEAPERYIHRNFRQVEIKSNKIQFDGIERRRLNLPKNDMSVIVEGLGSRFLVWSVGEYASRFPDYYKRFEFDEEDDEQ